METRASGRLVLLLVVCGCGGSQDPIVGTWKYQQGHAVGTWTFNADHSWASVTTGTDPSTQCVDTTNETATWSVTADTLTITPSSSSEGVSGCADASQDRPLQPDPSFDRSPNVSTFTIAGDTMTDAVGGNVVTLVRQ